MTSSSTTTCALAGSEVESRRPCRECWCLPALTRPKNQERILMAKARHGMSRTGTYKSWQAMLSRCMNPNLKDYHRYGGRGIKVCDRWHDFRNFLEDMGERPDGASIDRIDVNGNYEPGNCKWSDHDHQQNNRTSNRVITFDGRTQTVAQWAREIGCTRQSLHIRLSKPGASIETALSTPVKKPH